MILKTYKNLPQVSDVAHRPLVQNEGPYPSPKRYNSKIVKLCLKYLKTHPYVNDVAHGSIVSFCNL